MAIQQLQARLDNLFELVFSKDSSAQVRESWGEGRNLCLVGKKEIARSLMIAWEHYNPKKAQNHQEKDRISKVFDMFAADVLAGFKKILPKKVGKVEVSLARGSNQNVLRFVIEEDDPGRADNIFRDLNEEVVQALINSAQYSKYFTEERKTAGGVKPSGGMKNFQIAHGEGHSVFEGRQQVTKDELDSLLGIKDLPADAREEIRKGISQFNELFLESERDLKVKVVDGVIKTTDTIELSVQTARENLLDAKPAMSAGKQQKKVLANLIKNLQELVKKDSKSWGPRAKGSPSAVDLTGAAIVNTPTLTKMYASKKALNATRYKTAPKSVAPHKVSKSKQLEQKTRIIKGGGVTSTMKASGGRTKGKETGKGGATDQKDFALQMRHLLKVKNAINKRLPAEVRRNMGKPALMNRTGRFSNSAQIESIIPAAQTLMVKYSYRLNPYETFENTGKKKWPTGYNPKPLIAKSIRGLALGLVDEKLTVRRS